MGKTPIENAKNGPEKKQQQQLCRTTLINLQDGELWFLKVQTRMRFEFI